MRKSRLQGEAFYTANQWRLMWIRYRKHKAAYICGYLVLAFYLFAAFAEFVSPYDPYFRNPPQAGAPPMRIRFWDAAERRLFLRPFVYPTVQVRDEITRIRSYVPDTDTRLHLKFLVRGDEYKLWGLFRSDLHLFGIEGEEKLYLFGSDLQGRDLFSRIIYGSRISLTIGFIGVVISFTLGIIIGAAAGYFAGVVDLVVQRVIEVLGAIPSLPLWMAFSAVIPLSWSPISVFFVITVILAFMGWTGMARTVSRKLISLRGEDYIIAARLDGTGDARIMIRHMVPSFMSHLIASATLSIPGMILGETSLSFLGIGLRPPTISWGVLLQGAQNIQTVILRPWLLIPGIFVVVIVLVINFMGDGIRDAADPYA